MKTYVKRLSVLALAFMIVFAIPFAGFTQKASAASKKTKYVIASQTYSYIDDGVVERLTTQYQYDKNGLLISEISPEGCRNTYVRNKKGYITAEIFSQADGHVSDIRTFTYKYNKKGHAVRQNIYWGSGRDRGLFGTNTFTNYKNGKVKRETFTSSEGVAETVTYNKKGDMASQFSGNQKYYDSVKYTYKYDKHGNPIKRVSVYTSKDSDGLSSSMSVLTCKYTYGKHKRITKAVITQNGSTWTLEFKYKKVKMPKRYLKFYENSHSKVLLEP